MRVTHQLPGLSAMLSSLDHMVDSLGRCCSRMIAGSVTDASTQLPLLRAFDSLRALAHGHATGVIRMVQSV